MQLFVQHAPLGAVGLANFIKQIRFALNTSIANAKVKKKLSDFWCSKKWLLIWWLAVRKTHPKHSQLCEKLTNLMHVILISLSQIEIRCVELFNLIFLHKLFSLTCYEFIATLKINRIKKLPESIQTVCATHINAQWTKNVQSITQFSDFRSFFLWSDDRISFFTDCGARIMGRRIDRKS